MMKKLISYIFLIFLFFTNSLISQNLEIRLAMEESLHKQPFTGRALIFFNKNTTGSINSPKITNPMPSFAFDIKDWMPIQLILANDNSVTSWMGNIDSLNGWYAVQAVLKTNMQERFLGAAGNFFTEKSIVYIEKGKLNCPVNLLFNTLSPGRRKFRETKFIKEITIDSPLISEFYGDDEKITAAVVLPNSYFTDTLKFYPTAYVFPAWGSTHYDVIDGEFQQKRFGMGSYCQGEEKVFVYLDHDCRNGYHEFCNSESNGPREQSFFEDVLPFIEKNYRVYKSENKRFLMGHSSGAWAALWLLINNPGKFAAAFVGSPDPVDFTAFLGENIYSDTTNFFVGPAGEQKYLYKDVSMKDWIALDKLLGRGEQMYSFEACFSNKDSNGKPEHLFDWETGKINPGVAASWKNYDLSEVVRKLEDRSKELLSDKIHIYVADNDEFGLNVPVKAFKKVLDESFIDSEIIFFKEGGHSGFWTENLRNDIHKKMDEIIRKD